MPKRIIRLKTNVSPGTFFGSVYKRGGVITSKWGTKKVIPISYRDKHSGVIITSKGTILGLEKTKAHGWGRDYTKRRGLPKPAIFRPKKYQTPQQKKIMMELRKRGRL